MNIRLFYKVLLAVPVFAFAQTQVSADPATTPPSVTSEIDTYVKIIGAAITGLATLLGLPIVFLTYRKTRAEILKLELEAGALRNQQNEITRRSRDEER